MPARSQAQREFLNAKFGHAWVKRHHFDNRGSLPAHANAQTNATAARSALAKMRRRKR